MPNYEFEPLKLGTFLAYKRGLRSAQAACIERQWLGTFFSTLQTGSNVEEALNEANEEWELI